MILNARNGKKLPVYGDGMQVRDWLFVDDHCAAIYSVVTKGRVGETYCVGGDNQPANIEVVKLICKLLDEFEPGSAFTPHEQLIEYVPDRPGHDRRYDIKIDKIGAELGWEPGLSFEQGLSKTIAWYLENDAWVDAIIKASDYNTWVNKNYKGRDGSL